MVRKPIGVTLYTDPACRGRIRRSRLLRVLDWRYGGQLQWRLVVIGLSKDVSQYGSAAELQGKTSVSDGPVRFTARSVVFEQ